MIGFVRSAVAGLVVFSGAGLLAAESTSTSTSTTTAKIHTLALKPHQSATKDCQTKKARPLRHGIFRFTRYPAAWTAAQKTGRPILVYATANQCPYCVKMLEKTYKQEKITKLVEGSFETVYVDRHAQSKLVEKMHIKWYPTTIVVTPGNKVIDKIEGYVSPEEFTSRINTSLASAAKASKLAEVAKAERK